MEKTKRFFKEEIATIKEVLATEQVKGKEVIDFYNDRLKLYQDCLNEVNFISVNNCVLSSLPTDKDWLILDKRDIELDISKNEREPQQTEYTMFRVKTLREFLNRGKTVCKLP